MSAFERAAFEFVLAVSATVAVACSSTEGASSPESGSGGQYAGTGGGFGTGNPGGAGGNGASGGATFSPGGGASSGGNTSPGGSGGAAGSGGGSVTTGQCVDTSRLAKPSASTVTTCPSTPTSALPSGCVDSCSMDGCSGAHCVPQVSLPPTMTSSATAALAKCSDGSFCVPDDYIVTQGVYSVKSCKSLLGAEGRCTSTCIPEVNQQLTTLPKDSCGDGELCAPCFNPIDGTDTRACTVGCGDAPVSATPVTFQTCGGGQGVCVPQALVKDSTQLQSLKNVDDPTACTVGCPSGTPPACKDSDGDGPYVCAPIAKAQNQSYQFPSCTPSLASILGATKGGCVPKFLIPTGKQLLVAQDGCAAGTMCAPCTDPTANNAPTGACP